VTPRPAPRRGAAKGRPPRQGGRPLTGGQVGGPRRAPARDKEGLGGEQVEGRHAVLELLKAVAVRSSASTSPKPRIHRHP